MLLFPKLKKIMILTNKMECTSFAAVTEILRLEIASLEKIFVFVCVVSLECYSL